MLLALVVKAVSRHFDVWNEGELDHWREHHNNHSETMDEITIDYLLFPKTERAPRMAYLSLTIERPNIASMSLDEEGWQY